MVTNRPHRFVWKADFDSGERRSGDTGDQLFVSSSREVFAVYCRARELVRWRNGKTNLGRARLSFVGPIGLRRQYEW